MGLRTAHTPTGGCSRESSTMGESLMERHRVRDEGLRIVNRFFMRTSVLRTQFVKYKVHKVKSYKVNAKYFMNFTNFQLYKLLATCALRAVSSPMSNLGAQLRNRIGY